MEVTLESVIETALVQAPALTVLVVLTVLFLRHLKARDEQYSKTVAGITTTMTAIEDRCHETAKESAVALQQVSKATTENTTVLAYLKMEIGNLPGRIASACPARPQPQSVDERLKDVEKRLRENLLGPSEGV